MHEPFIEPKSEYVLVLDCPQETVIDGITLPDNQRQQEMVFGLVVSVGPDAAAAGTKPTDRIIYGPYAGKTVVIDGVQFRILRDGQIEGYIRTSN